MWYRGGKVTYNTCVQRESRSLAHKRNDPRSALSLLSASQAHTIAPNASFLCASLTCPLSPRSSLKIHHVINGFAAGVASAANAAAELLASGGAAASPPAANAASPLALAPRLI